MNSALWHVLFVAFICFLNPGCRAMKNAEYFERYESAEVAYMGKDIKLAEHELSEFSSFLIGTIDRVSNGKVDSRRRAYVVTQIRLYDIYMFKNETLRAKECVEAAQSVLEQAQPGGSSDVDHAMFDDFIRSMQEDPIHVPLWKKSAVSKEE